MNFVFIIYSYNVNVVTDHDKQIYIFKPKSLSEIIFIIKYTPIISKINIHVMLYFAE